MCGTCHQGQRNTRTHSVRQADVLVEYKFSLEKVVVRSEKVTGIHIKNNIIYLILSSFIYGTYSPKVFSNHMQENHEYEQTETFVFNAYKSQKKYYVRSVEADHVGVIVSAAVGRSVVVDYFHL